MQARGLLIDIKQIRSRLGGYYEHPEIDPIKEEEEAKSELVFSDESTGAKVVNVDHIALYTITNSTSTSTRTCYLRDWE